MRVVIIKSTNTVLKDGLSIDNLDLSSCGLPSNLWALQWNEKGGEKGHIEYDDPLVQNEDITELPSWANSCLTVYQTELDRIEAEAAAALAAAEAAAAEAAANP